MMTRSASKRTQEAEVYSTLNKPIHHRKKLRSYKKNVPVDLQKDINGNSAKPSSNKSSLWKIANRTDPISLDRITKRNAVVFNRNGIAMAYDVRTLASYIFSSGDFSDPQTRLAFSVDDLTIIDKKVKKLKLPFPPFVSLSKNSSSLNDAKFIRDGIQAIENCAGEVVVEILRFIERSPVSNTVEFSILIESQLDQLLDYYYQICDVSKESGAHCIESWISFLLGPPNKPNMVNRSLIQHVVGILSLESRIVHDASSLYDDGDEDEEDDIEEDEVDENEEFDVKMTVEAIAENEDEDEDDDDGDDNDVKGNEGSSNNNSITSTRYSNDDMNDDIEDEI